MIKELLEKINETKNLSELDLSAWDPRTRPGMEMRKAESKTELASLLNQYRNELTGRIFGIFALGTNGGRFAELSEGNFGITVDALSLYKRLAKAAMGLWKPGNNFSVDQVGRITEELYDVARELGIESMPNVRLTAELSVSIKDEEDMVSHCKKFVETYLNSDLAKMYMIKEALDRAVELRWSGRVLPVIFYNLSKDDMGGMQKQPSIVAKGRAFDSNEEETISEEFVTKFFSDLKEKLQQEDA